MKAFQIEDAKTRFFKSKEDYLNFKQAWKDFHNEGLHIERGQWTTPHGNVKEYKNPLLSTGHYMLYNLLRGYDISRGYCEHSKDGWAACDAAAGEIIQAARRVADVNSSSEWSRRYAREAIAKLRLPFGNTVSNETLYELASELYNHFSGQPLPTIVVEEEKSFGKAATVRKVVKAIVKV
jgi:hypothetical protein